MSISKVRTGLISLTGLCLLLSGCSNTQVEPKAVKGLLDISGWDFYRNGVIDLSGEYEFYWQQHLFPEDFADSSSTPAATFIKVNKPWNGFEVNGDKISSYGFATYRLTLMLPPECPILAFRFQDMGTAFRVFANGDLLIAVGEAGETRAATLPKYRPQIAEFTPQSSRLELIFHISNFHHARGGLWEVVQVGPKWIVYKARGWQLALDLVMFGIILIMGLYHLAFMTLRKRAKPAVYFGIFCLLIAIRLLTITEKLLLHILPDMNWELFEKIEYLSYYLSLPIFALYLNALFPKDMHKRVLNVVLLIGFVASGIVLIFPAKVFTGIMLPFHIFNLACILYAFYLLIVCTTRKREGARIVLVGFVLIAVCVINDILDANSIIHTGHFAHLGLVLFIFSQAFLQAFRFTKAFDTIEIQHAELTRTNRNYKQELMERRRAEKENRQLQEKLTRSQKMEALGLLAGGVAHDLNNILTGVVTYPDLLLLDLPKTSPLYEPLETIKQSGIKAADIVQDLLTLARRGVINLQTVNLNEIVSDYLHSPEADTLKRNHPTLDIKTQLDPHLNNIKGSAIHLRKTAMNLVTNAAESLPRNGEVTISTQNCFVDKPMKGYEDIQTGNYVLLTVEDKGCGITENDFGKIFEPFYTRKKMGRSGTGLGMAVVWGTVHDHKGFIDVQSKSGYGSSFNLYFPVTTEQLPEGSRSIPIETYMGNETVMVVDDVEEQRIIASRILAKLGYKSIAVASGEEAVEYINTHPVDLILLDMIMEPGIDGLETYRKIVEQHGPVKAVIASGFSETDRVKQTQKLGAGIYVKKPYSLEKIGLAVRSELDK